MKTNLDQRHAESDHLVHTYITDVKWLLVLRKPSNRGETKRLVRILTGKKNMSFMRYLWVQEASTENKILYPVTNTHTHTSA